MYAHVWSVTICWMKSSKGTSLLVGDAHASYCPETITAYVYVHA